MLFRSRVIWTVLVLMIVCSCSQSSSGDQVTRWGKDNYYDTFLWKKYVPDTLTRELAFDFNDDARNFMTEPLRLGLFKKNDFGKMVQVKEDEMGLFLDGQKCEDNVANILPGSDLVKLSVVFNPQAANKVHHWFFRTVSDAGLERINDMDSASFNDPDASLLDIEVEKNEIMNPLKVITIGVLLVILFLLILWFVVLKWIFYPTFRVGRIELTDPEPYNSRRRLSGARLLVLTSKPQKQGMIDRLFAGRILYDVNPLWTTDIVIEPKDRVSVRIKPSREYFVDARVLKVHQEYTIENMNTRNKTKVKIS